MRTWLYNRIRALAGFPGGMVDRVISSGAAENPVKPFMVLTMGLEDNPLVGTTPEMRVQNIPFTVWVHDTPGSMLNIDEACRILKEGMPLENGAVVGNMSIYRIKWEGTGEDAYDDHFLTNTRPVRFSMVTHRN